MCLFPLPSLTVPVCLEGSGSDLNGWDGRTNGRGTHDPPSRRWSNPQSWATRSPLVRSNYCRNRLFT